MTPKRRTVKPVPYPWAPKQPEPAPEPAHLRSAKRLQMPGPGIVVTVPLSLLPEYLALYGLVPNGYQEPNTLLVKRAGMRGEAE